MKNPKRIISLIIGLLGSSLILIFLVVIGIKVFKYNLTLSIILVVLSVFGLVIIWNIIKAENKRDEEGIKFGDEFIIKIPKNYTIDTKEKGIIKFVKKNAPKKLPSSWSEFCKLYPKKSGECFIDPNSEIIVLSKPGQRQEDKHRLLINDKETAEAFLALMQLIQLRNIYVGTWKPDWKDFNASKFSISRGSYDKEIKITKSTISPKLLSFPDEEMCTKFFTNFKDLIKIAKPLL